MNALGTGQTVDISEINHFDKLSQYWWDERGPFKTLHQLNPVRIQYIQEHVQKYLNSPKNPQVCSEHSQSNNKNGRSLNDLTVLDVGCGGGLLSEPLTRLGAAVTGIDASLENIKFAQQHAQEMGLSINYMHKTLEDFDQRFDIVTALEIIEHVSDPATFINHCCRLVKPGGLLFLSTINRTFKAYLLAVKVAEDLANLVPRGTHQWQKFVRPKEMQRYLAKNNFQVLDQTGISVDILRKTMKISSNTDINYMLVARHQ